MVYLEVKKDFNTDIGEGLMAGYVDLYILPIPEKNLNAYKRMARKFGEVIMELGALEYREFMGDDLFVKGMIPLPTKFPLKKGEIMIFSVVGFRSKAHRNQVNKKLMRDPRLHEMGNMGNEIMDCKKIIFGGYKTIVEG